MEKIKKYWKEILIGVLILFGMNKCTTSCNRNQTIKKQQIELVQKDSTISALVADTLRKAHTIDLMKEQINTANANTQVAIEKENTAKANEKTAQVEAEAERLRKLKNKQ